MPVTTSGLGVRVEGDEAHADQGVVQVVEVIGANPVKSSPPAHGPFRARQLERFWFGRMKISQRNFTAVTPVTVTVNGVSHTPEGPTLHIVKRAPNTLMVAGIVTVIGAPL